MNKSLPPLNEDLRLAQMRKERMKIAKWLETRRGKPQYRPPPQAARAVARVVKPLSKKFSGHKSAAQLLPHWPTIIGQKWAKFSRPEKFAGDKNGKTLIISAPGPASALIMANAGPILERVNLFMGEGSVTNLRVIQKKMNSAVQSNLDKNPALRGLSPLEENALKAGLDHIQEEDLKKALSDLGRYILQKNTPDTASQTDLDR